MTCTNNPAHWVRTCFWKVGSKATGRSVQPEVTVAGNASNRRQGSIQGAPNCSNGVVVPRPSLNWVPSTST